MNKVLNIFCDAESTSVYNIREINSSFAVATLDVMYTGQNPNGSNIPREAVEAAIPTLPNVPIVCNYDPDSKEIGGHDIEFVSDDDGNVHIRNLTVPCGVVTDHTKFYFEKKKDKHGVEHEYFVADGVILWKRQEVYDYIINDLGGVVPHSMEINVTDGAKNRTTGYYDINSFEFSALCLLGSVRPCFEGSKITVYQDESVRNELKDKVAEMMSELKECYSMIAPAIDAVDNNTIHSTKGGDVMSEEITKLAEEFGIDVNALDFSLEGMSVDDVRKKFEEMTSDNSNSTDSDDENGGSEGGADDGEKFELNRQIERSLYEAVSAEKVSYDWGDMPKYYLEDFDTEKGEVYVMATEDWNLYGFKYAMDGDNVVIDWDSRARKKYAIVDFDEGTTAQNTVASVFSAMSEVIIAARGESAAFAEQVASMNQKIEDMTAKYDAVSAEVTELREYKSNAENDIRNEMIEGVLSEFAELSGVEAFDDLKASLEKDNTLYTKDALEEKCFAILGRVKATTKFSAEVKAPKIHVDKIDDTDDVDEKPYGGIVEKYAGN